MAVDPSSDFIGDEDIPLTVINDKELWLTHKDYWETHDAIGWAVFMWRIVVPPVNKPGIISSWNCVMHPGIDAR